MRLVSLALALCAVLGGCTVSAGEGDGHGSGEYEHRHWGTAEEWESLSAREMFDAHVLPALFMRCADCHMGVSDSPLTFLGEHPGNYYELLSDNARLVTDDPTTSLLVNMGPHTGPAFEPVERDVVSTWITKEASDDPGGDDSGGDDSGGDDGKGDEVGQPQPEICVHDVCEIGNRQPAGCNECVQAVCDQDWYCCIIGWDQTCVDLVAPLCEQTCL